MDLRNCHPAHHSLVSASQRRGGARAGTITESASPSDSLTPDRSGAAAQSTRSRTVTPHE